MSFLLVSFECILSAHFIECFREMLLEHNNKVIDAYNMSFSYCGEMEAYREPQAVPK